MKGIVLAGGSGTRLFPATMGVSKQLIPIYDKPMVYYPLSILMLSGLKEVLIITTEQDQATFKLLLGNGAQWGMAIEYVVQPSPDGLAQAFILAEDFLNGDSVCLVLGDNIYYGHGLTEQLLSARACVEKNNGACVFGYGVSDPERYGVVEFDTLGNVLSVEEKPEHPKSNYAITGLYFYDHHVCEYAKQVKPSERGELEITDLNEIYLDRQELKVEKLGRGYAWLDTGTHESLIEASRFISTIENRQGIKVACLEEIAWEQNWISGELFERAGQKMKKNQYGQYILRRLREV